MSAPTWPILTASIVSHGNANEVIRLLDSLQRFEESRHLQVILTDNLGTELPDIDPSPWARLTILRNQQPSGFARNHNQAFQHAIGSYFATLNPDVVFIEPVFESLINSLETKGIDILAPLVVNGHNRPQDSFRSLPSPINLLIRQLNRWSWYREMPENSGDFVYPDWIAGIFLIMASSVYQSLQGFDERYWLYFEDTEFCTRARLQGLQLAVDTRRKILHTARHASHRKLVFFLHHLHSAVHFFASDTYKEARKVASALIKSQTDLDN